MKKLLLLFFSCLFLQAATAQDFRPYFSNNFNFGASYTNGQAESQVAAYGDRQIDYVGLQFNYIGLFHLTPKVAIGAGTGVRHVIEVDADWDYWGDDDDIDFLRNYISIPLYAHASFRFIDKRVSPFLSASLGYNFRVGSHESSHTSTRFSGTASSFYAVEERSHLSSGILAGAQAGVSIRVGSRFDIMTGPYFEYRKSTLNSAIQDGTSFSSSQRDLNLYEVGVKVGFAF
ncbi:outer membrane beta-barrel protein [Sphingobacterium paludis]|jgi:hypothetical protein|uniref:Outer membrane protein with beta-barrel domain n=1 Tax=Sphingobacterium paludis TaxID=1476465 RepID=A0A4R7CZ25_9SPHI|nr:hypothetical protein [Sphingobacterium paludis]TDS13011.1 hypothetical protein B0I21_105143 [Sphingobacterium paludis]